MGVSNLQSVFWEIIKSVVLLCVICFISSPRLLFFRFSLLEFHFFTLYGAFSLGFRQQVVFARIYTVDIILTEFAMQHHLTLRNLSVYSVFWCK